MTQEDKQLLLKDLCARLPYGVKVRPRCGHNAKADVTAISLDRDYIQTRLNVLHSYAGQSVEDIRPYLRPMSSMTEEERLYFHRNSARVPILVDEEKIITKPFYGYTVHLFDWLNAHHFDYHGLIEKGLALEALDGMYKTE